MNVAVGANPSGPSTTTARSPWDAIVAWAQALADRTAGDQPAHHVTVFVHDPAAGALRLAGQVWNAGEDAATVVVAEWLAPLEGSVCGRVFRTGAAALCADVGLDPDYRAFPGGRTRSSLTVPFGPEGTVVGVINAEAPWTSAFSIADYERLTELAAAAAATMPGSAVPNGASPPDA
jgi:GAF domain-containing protein